MSGMEDGMKDQEMVPRPHPNEFRLLVQDPKWKARWEANCKADALHKVMMNQVLGSPEYVMARRKYLEATQAALEVVQ